MLITKSQIRRFLPFSTLSLLGIINICLGVIGIFAFGSVLVTMAALLAGFLEYDQIPLLKVTVYELAYDPFGWFVLIIAVFSKLLLLMAGIGYLRRSRFQGWIIGNLYVVVSFLEGVLILVVASEMREILENAVFRVYFFALPLVNGILLNSYYKQRFINK